MTWRSISGMCCPGDLMNSIFADPCLETALKSNLKIFFFFFLKEKRENISILPPADCAENDPCPRSCQHCFVLWWLWTQRANLSSVWNARRDFTHTAKGATLPPTFSSGDKTHDRPGMWIWSASNIYWNIHRWERPTNMWTIKVSLHFFLCPSSCSKDCWHHSHKY